MNLYKNEPPLNEKLNVCKYIKIYFFKYYKKNLIK